MPTRLFNTIVLFGAALASSSLGCGGGASPSPSGTVVEGDNARDDAAADASPQQDGAMMDAGDATASDAADVDVDVIVDAGWPPTK